MDRINNLFKAFTETKVLVIGDVMIDRYLYGHTSRISPEAPVPVVELGHTEDRLGGAANVALNLKAMGATPFLCSVIGEDADGEIFSRTLETRQISQDGIVHSQDRMTTVKSRVMARGQQLIRLDREEQKDLNEEEENNLLGKVRKTLEDQEIHVVLFQDYNKGVLSAQVIRKVLAEAKKRDIPVVVDPKEANFFEYRQATLFKPNLREIATMIETSVNPDKPATLRQASQAIRKQLDHTYTLITLSDKGMYFDAPDSGFLMPAQVRNVADVCGAGDTVVSLAALGIANKMEFKELVELANLAGGLVCERVGVVPIDCEELKREFIELVISNWGN